MISKAIINDKYRQFLPTEATLDNFIELVDNLRQQINLDTVNRDRAPILIYNIGSQNALQYLLAVNYTLQRGKVLDYESVRAQTFVRQHFADSDRDQVLYDSIYYKDLLFITLTQADYTSEYMESLLQDLLEFRGGRGANTVVIYEVIDRSDKSYLGYTKKLRDFFGSRNYPVIDLIKTGITTKHSETKDKGKSLVGSRGGRII